MTSDLSGWAEAPGWRQDFSLARVAVLPISLGLPTPLRVRFDVEVNAAVVQSDDGESWIQCRRDERGWVVTLSRAGVCPAAVATGLPEAPPA